jgi:hypothetical protein
VEAEQAAGGAQPDGSVRRREFGGFDQVFGSAISNAVRRAVDDVARATVDPVVDPVVEPGVDPVDQPTPTLPPSDVVDPYELLGVSRRAPWADIAAAYKRRARAWHPDGAPPEEQAGREELIRRLNVAYADLRVRRGR